MIRCAALILLLSPAAAMAAPVSLACTLDDEGQAVPMSVQLNEEAGSASWYWPESGASAKRGAIFTPVNVTFGAFTLDRNTLSIIRANDSVMVAEGKAPPTTAGKCAIDTTKRAF